MSRFSKPVTCVAPQYGVVGGSHGILSPSGRRDGRWHLAATQAGCKHSDSDSLLP
jgi:hypothetical protein